MRRIILFMSLLLAGFALMLLSTRCEKVTFKEAAVDTTVVVDTVVISFVTDIKPIFKNCTMCHSGAQNPNLSVDPYNALVPKYVSAADAAKPDNSTFLNWLETDPAHKPRTTDAQKTLIRTWISQGVLNN